ncbi:MAG: FG-GAP repeat domain-containing protein [Planctomycetota bacterium]
MKMRLAAGAAVATVALGLAAFASDGIGNLSLVSTTGNPTLGATAKLALSGPSGAIYTLSMGLPGGGNIPLVGPVDIALPYFVTMANGALPGSGDLIFIQPVPVAPALVGLEVVYQAAAVDGSSPTGIGISNPVRIEIAPTSTFAFAEVPTAMPILPVANGLEPVVGDVDGDGDIDAYVPTMSANLMNLAAVNVLLLNGGAGTFSDASATQLPAVLESSVCAVLADLDGDFDLDLAVGNGIDSIVLQLPTVSHLYSNDGTGHFTLAADFPGGADYVSSLAAGDADGDGDIDLVMGRNGNGAGAPERLLLNDGAGNFTDGTSGPGTGIPAFTDATSRVILADVDKDGDPDLVVGNYGTSGARLHRNNGAGLFTTLAGAFPSSNSAWLSDLAVADLNGDGDVDAVGIALPSGSGTSFVRVYANNGSGVYSYLSNGVTGMPATPDLVDVGLGDLDGDGDVDVVAAGLSSGADWLLLNNGTGNFTVSTAQVAAPAWTRNPIPLDADGDNLLDLLYSANAPNGTARLLLR